MKQTGILLIIMAILNACSPCPKPELQFGAFTDVRNDWIYRTVEIHSFLDSAQQKPIVQTWFLDNLRFEVPKHSRTYHFGVYYNPTLFFESTLCPKGWHIPTLEEWNIFMDFIDSDSRTGKCHPLAYLFFDEGAMNISIYPDTTYYHHSKIAIRLNVDSVRILSFGLPEYMSDEPFRPIIDEIETIDRATANSTAYQKKEKMAWCRCVRD